MGYFWKMSIVHEIRYHFWYLQLGLESWNTNLSALWSKLPRQLTPLHSVHSPMILNYCVNSFRTQEIRMLNDACNISHLGVVHKLRWQDEMGRWYWKYQRYADRKGIPSQMSTGGRWKKKPRTWQSSLWTTPYWFNVVSMVQHNFKMTLITMSWKNFWKNILNSVRPKPIFWFRSDTEPFQRENLVTVGIGGVLPSLKGP